MTPDTQAISRRQGTVAVHSVYRFVSTVPEDFITSHEQPAP